MISDLNQECGRSGLTPSAWIKRTARRKRNTFRMADVYENATHTLIWLGKAADNSDLAMDNMESLTHKLLTVKNPGSLTVRQRLTNYDLPLPEDQKWEALKVLQLQPWIFRLWTLQEIVLSKEAVPLCGRKSSSWDALVGFLASGNHSGNHSGKIALDVQGGSKSGNSVQAISNCHGPCCLSTKTQEDW